MTGRDLLDRARDEVEIIDRQCAREQHSAPGIVWPLLVGLARLYRPVDDPRAGLTAAEAEGVSFLDAMRAVACLHRLGVVEVSYVVEPGTGERWMMTHLQRRLHCPLDDAGIDCSGLTPEGRAIVGALVLAGVLDVDV